MKDVVKANILALTGKEATGEISNIATGVATTVSQLVETLREILDKKDLKPIHKEP